MAAHAQPDGGDGTPVRKVPGGEPEHPPSQDDRHVELLDVGLVPRTAVVTAATGDPDATVHLDGKPEIRPREIEPPPASPVAGKRMFGNREGKAGLQEQGHEPAL